MKESRTCKLRIVSILFACMLTPSRVMVTRAEDKYRNTDATVLSECGEVTKISVKAAI